MAITDASPKEIEAEESSFPDTPCENIPELCVPSPACEVLVDNPVVDDVPSSPSECEGKFSFQCVGLIVSLFKFSVLIVNVSSS